MNSTRWRIELVRIETIQLDAAARMEVSDHGIDARPANPKGAFELFKRRMAAATIGGLAWGLRLVKKVAHLHAATASVPGQGTTILTPSGNKMVMTTAANGHVFDGTAPDFTLPVGDGRAVALRDHRAHTLILVSYLADWSPVSATTLTLFREAPGKMRDQNAEILAISGDDAFPLPDTPRRST